jgi:hypothetical protein
MGNLVVFRPWVDLTDGLKIAARTQLYQAANLALRLARLWYRG